jgi:subfamily B ATP-binding cassette protein MsbA
MRSDGHHLYLRLLRYVAPYRRSFTVAIVAMVVLAATEPAIPALLKPTLDGSFVHKDMSIVGLMATLFVVVFLIRGAAAYVSALAMAWVAGKVVMDLRNAMFAKLLTLPSAYFDAEPSGKIVSKITFDASQVTEAASYVITVLVEDTLRIVGLLAFMLYLDWKLTLIALATVPLVILVVQHFSRRLRAMSQSLQQAMGDVTHAVDETIAGEKVVRTFGGQAYEQQRFRRIVNWVRRYQLKFASAAAATAPIAQLIAAVALAIILYIAAHQSAAGHITVGGFASFFSAMALLFSPLKRLTSINGRLQKGIAGAASSFGLLDHPSEPDTGHLELGSIEGRIEFEDVSFAYPGTRNAALRHVTLRIEPGETVALVGASGSGKTTLANLIPRFYRPTGGRILVGGSDVESVTLTSLRRNIALVNQDVVLFDDTVAANIGYGPLAGVGEERIRRAAEGANALEFIEGLPLGFATMIGENGVRLSGGQRQRIAIARAFLKDAPILILDEATSSLDAVSEREVQTAIERLRQGRTTIVIAHKLSTIENADRIIVMSAGEIVGSGRHRELLDANSYYAALYRFQFSSRLEEAAMPGAHRYGV